jgi:TolB-like protein/DNA-binding winged helix-turn-helix (wHTH) protein
MSASVSAPRRLSFGPFEADLRSGELLKNGNRVRLQAQPFQLLVILLERPGELVTREEICSRLWRSDTFVDFERSLGTAVNKIREVLDDSATEPRFVETLPRRGYRFVAPVVVIREAGPNEAGAIEPEPSEPPPSEPKANPPRKASLRRIVWAGIAAAVVVSALTGWTVLRSQPLRSIVVLPLANVSADPNQQFFADGVTDELTTDLAEIGSFRVISHTSAVAYAGTHKSAPQIAKELGVDALVEGNVARSGDRVRITAQLIRADSESHLWAHTYDFRLGDVLTAQGEIARAIAASISQTLTPQEKTRLSRPRPLDPDVALLLFKGSFFLSKLDALKANEIFSEAVQRDPNCAECLAGQADALHTMGVMDDHYEAFALARDAANRALKIDHSQAQALMVLGVVSFLYDWDPAKSEVYFRQSIAARPGFAMAHALFANTLVHRGRFEEALAEFKLASALDPVSVVTNLFGWNVYFGARHYDEALRVALAVQELDPAFELARGRLARSWEQKGDYNRAIAAAGQDPSLKAALAAGGPRGYWQRELDIKLTGRASDSHYDFSSIARCYMHLGQREEALQTLEKGYQMRDPLMILWLPTEEDFDPLRPDPRFQKMLDGLGVS